MMASDRPRTLRSAIRALTNASRLSRREDWAPTVASGARHARSSRNFEYDRLMITGVGGAVSGANAPGHRNPVRARTGARSSSRVRDAYHEWTRAISAGGPVT